MNNFKKLSLAGILAAGLTLVGCVGEDTAPVPNVTIKVSTDMGGVNASQGSLSKGNVIKLKSLVIVLTSNASVPDTVRDTITASSSPVALSTTSTAQQVITKNYTVKGLRTWKIVATVRDSLDTITHRDSATTGTFVKVADTAAVSLNLASKFMMYEATFTGLPSVINTSAGTGHTQAVTYKRFVLKVNGVTVKDSTSPSSFSAPGPHTISYDYFAVNSTPTTHNIRLIVYGITGATYNDSLFAGSATVLAVQNNGADSTKAVSLGWVGPNTGTEKVTVTIGKVGKTTVNGTATCGSGCVPKTR